MGFQSGARDARGLAYNPFYPLHNELHGGFHVKLFGLGLRVDSGQKLWGLLALLAMHKASSWLAACKVFIIGRPPNESGKQLRVFRVRMK